MGAALVDLYWVAGQANLEALVGQAAILEPGEQERAGRFVRPCDQTLYRAAHVLLRRSLSRYAEIEPQQWYFVSNPDGRPEIDLSAHPEAQSLRFNLSHSGQVACCGITRGAAVGVDVEQERSIPRVEALAKRFFTPAEAAAVAGLPPEQQVGGFLSYWTLKEAALKATGRGLQDGLDAIAFQIHDQTVVAKLPQLARSESAQGQVLGWRFALLEIELGLPCALAVALHSAQQMRLCIHRCGCYDAMLNPAVVASTPGVTVHQGPNLGVVDAWRPLSNGWSGEGHFNLCEKRMTEASSAPNAVQIQGWIRDYLVETLQVDPKDIDPQRPFTEYGLDSAAVVILTGDLEEWLARDLDPTLLQDYTTLEVLANHLSSSDTH
uniref:Carrier domain-containing protein n=1 Tax=Magnetococcus massalia (strain MO-1) TaxID=451514 RepID=A0A1S7LG70_MAGMO|nr:protein of unknown function [include conserved 4'-phosphopantetheinyl transferase domain and Phosphopantetheine-binding domain] [Candidatus Magnetococcus massalia]